RESLLASMSPEAFRALVASHATVRERLLRRLAGSVRELAARLLDFGARRVQARVWAELLRVARAAAQGDGEPRGHLARGGDARAVAAGAPRAARAQRARAGAARRARARDAGRRRGAGGGRGAARRAR